MRLYLLPISTKRTLLYCHRLEVGKAEKQTWSERIQSRVAKTWADWEKKDRGWQKSVVNYGNYALRRIPYEEWGLKSVPPLSERRRVEELKGTDKVEVLYPEALIPTGKVTDVLGKLATEREALHRKKLIWCFVGMPLTAPVALIPLIPNLPFFYLVYRAWSHWRALSGGKHIQFLIQNQCLNLTRSPIIDQIYAKQTPSLASPREPATQRETEESQNSTISAKPRVEHHQDETMLLTQENCKKMTEALGTPQLEVELERAIWQVENAIGKESGRSDKEASADSSENTAPNSETDKDDKKPR